MLLGAIAIVGGIAVAIAVVVSTHYRKSQLDEMEATLKMEMIQRGMAADDIAKVLGAKMAGSKPSLNELLANFDSAMPGMPASSAGEDSEHDEPAVCRSRRGSDGGHHRAHLSLLIVFMTVIITGHYRRMQRDDMEATLENGNDPARHGR